MKNADHRQHQTSEMDSEVLSSMICELIRHYERHVTGNEPCLDWQSPGKRTQIIKYGTSTGLFNVLNQVPDAIAAEYRLDYQGALIFSWQEYRWPQFHGARSRTTGQTISLPTACVDDLMRYHMQANTSWLYRYRASLGRDRSPQVKKVGVVAETDCISAL